MNDSRSWGHDFRFYEELKVVNDMNYLESHELKALDAMNNSIFWIILMILGCELKPLDVMNSLGLWMTWLTKGHELRALDVINSLGL